RDVRAGVPAAHRDDDVRPLGVRFVEAVRHAAGEVEPELAHGVDHLRVDVLCGRRAGGAGLVTSVGGQPQERLRHLRAAGVLAADEEDARHSPRTSWQASPPTDVPRTGATRYSQSAWRSPETSAGPSERMGFIDAPEIGPPTIASRPIVPPIAIAAASPTCPTA